VGTVALIDMLKEAILRTGCLRTVTDIAKGARMSVETLTERLLLVLYAYGTNTGIRAVAAGDHGHSEDDLRCAPPASHSRASAVGRDLDRQRDIRRPRLRDLGADLDHRRL